MTEMILGWQLFILATMIVARLFSSSGMIKLGLFWTVWTFVMLFLGPLVMLQLCTIWLPVLLLAKRGKLSPAPAKKKVVTKPTASSQAQPKFDSSPNFLREFATGAEKLNEAAKTYHEKTFYRIEFKQQFREQATLVKSMMRAAQTRAEIERKFDGNPDLHAYVEKRMAELEGADRLKLSDNLFTSKPLPYAPRMISWPSDPTKRGWVTEILTAHLDLLTDAKALIEKEKYLEIAVNQLRGSDFIPWLEEEANVLRDLLGLPREHIKARRTARPSTNGFTLSSEETVQSPQSNVFAESSLSQPRLFQTKAQPSSARAHKLISKATIDVAPSPEPQILPQIKTIVPLKPSRTPVALEVKLLGSDLGAAQTQVNSSPQIERDGATAIRLVAEGRGIPHLTHFTRVGNLSSILEHGLLSCEKAKSLGIEQSKNDTLRLDRRLDWISTSIAFPNFSMFYKYRSDGTEGDWVVILLKKEILWTHDCLFTPHNAADIRVVQLDEKELTGEAALERLFTPVGRSDSLRPCDPTDPQAEAMVKSCIGPEWIDAIAFETKDALRRYDQHASGHETFYCGPNSGLFASRFSMLKNLR